ncbi:MAG: TonB family protein [Verrucomicrobiaceae bacterium]|nr:TonB family protein [Verrucomicrobiaceae bacterium]
MKNALFGFLAALGLHAFVFLFGGLLIPKGEKKEAKKELVEVVDLDKKEEKKEEEAKEKLDDPVEDIKQELPDFRELNQPAASAAPALAAVSLSDLGSALSGVAGDGGGFGGGVGFGSGVIGGSGGVGGLGSSDILSGGQLDSQPQPTNRTAPRLSPDVRKRIKGKIDVLIVVGKDGSVQKAEILESPDPAANAACIEAARQWRFQPGSRDGKPVSFKLKLPFRFD